MRKKLLISLTPLLAFVAFVTTSPTAQAARYAVNKTPAGEAHVPVVSWGALKLSNSAGGTPVECENGAAGWVDNVANVGHGETNGWTAYNCKDSECEAAGGKLGVIFENENGPQSNPVKLTWPSVLEGSSPKIRTNSTNVKVYVHCQFVGEPSEEKAGTGPLEGLELRVSVEANAPGSVSCEAGPTSKGTSTPLTVNAELPLPGKVTFSGGAGGELACNNGGKGVTTGSLKILGFEAGEEIRTENSTVAAVPDWWFEGQVMAGSQELAEETTVPAAHPFEFELARAEGSIKFTVKCTGETVLGGAIEAPSSRVESADVYENCKDTVVSEEAECEIGTGGKITTDALTSTLEGADGNIKLKFKSKTPPELAAYKITQIGAGTGCKAVGSYRISGVMICNYSEVEREKEIHPLEFTEMSGTEIKSSHGAEPEVKAGFKGTDEVHLKNKKKWSAFS
jgi:hypothetical protein